MKINLLKKKAAKKEDGKKAPRPVWYKTLFRRNANIFVKAARTLALALIGYLGFEASLPHVLDGRPLHDNEIRVLQKMGYDDSIDYSKVKIHSSAFADRYMNLFQMHKAAKGNVVMVRSKNHVDDFTKADEIEKFFFLHEMGHVWQHQNRVMLMQGHALKDAFSHLVLRRDVDDHYEYRLKDGKDLMNYGLEQQPNIIADFYRLSQKGSYPLMMREGAKADTYTPEGREELAERYRNVLGDFLEDPHYARNRVLQPWK